MKFIAFSDDNCFTIDGRTEFPFTEDVAKRYEAHDVQGLTVQDVSKDVDASLQEGISHESCTYAGHLGLGQSLALSSGGHL